MKFLIFSFFFIASMLTGSLAETSAGNALADQLAAAYPQFTLVPDVVYKTVDGKDLQMNLMIPRTLPRKPAPLLVYIHGGGWGHGDRYAILRAPCLPVIKQCGDAGVICAAIEYRLVGRNSTVYDSVVDCKDALRYLAKNAETYSIDPKRIAIFGNSAGGHLSLLAALGKPEDFPGDPALASYDPDVRCEVAYYPATDFTVPEMVGKYLRPPRDRTMLGGSFAEKKGLARLLSPVWQIRADSPAVYLFHGDRDPTLSVENSRQLFKQGKVVGADIQYMEIKNGVHGFGTDCSPTIDEIGSSAARFILDHLK
ncbi:MAG: alpha/beta hydrolase fold domain-containing protein [Kiritimatiellales bacterium]